MSAHKTSWLTVLVGVIWIWFFWAGMAVLIEACIKRPGPPPPPAPVVGRYWEDAIEKCNPTPGDPETVLCPTEVFKAAIRGCVLNWEAASLGAVELTRCQDLGKVDVAELSGQLWEQTQEAEHQSTLKWVWGGVALAVGLVLGAGVTIGIMR